MSKQYVDEACRREIAELHRFFQDWYRGEVPATADAFGRLSQVLHHDFHIVTPRGRVLRRDAILDRVRSGHGRESAGEPPYRIEVRNVQRVADLEGFSVYTYEEWQGRGEAREGWLSSALLVPRAQAPNGFGWVHVHETALQLPEERR